MLRVAVCAAWLKERTELPANVSPVRFVTTAISPGGLGATQFGSLTVLSCARHWSVALGTACDGAVLPDRGRLKVVRLVAMTKRAAAP
jgi:hypothetical protein